MKAESIEKRKEKKDTWEMKKKTHEKWNLSNFQPLDEIQNKWETICFPWFSLQKSIHTEIRPWLTQKKKKDSLFLFLFLLLPLYFFL